MKYKKYIYSGIIIIVLLLSYWGFFGKESDDTEYPYTNYGKSIRILRDKVWHDMRRTIYCGASYNKKGEISLPEGFTSLKHKSRSHRIEWEHAVPVENFGRAFKEWREGDPACVSNGRSYKGRKCAGKVNPEFQAMEGDMYNLFPSIGSVNAARGNKQYAELPDEEPDFGSCLAKVEGKYFEPPDRAKGQVARASLYMDSHYSKFRLSRKQKKLFSAWNAQFPPDAQECERGRRIAELQKNENIFISKACAQAGL